MREPLLNETKTNSETLSYPKRRNSAGLMNMAAYVERVVNPSDLRFSVYSIPNWIHDGGKKVLLDELLEKLESGERTPKSFRTMEVSNDARDKQLYSNDNEILWLFRKAKVAKVKVKVYSKQLSRAPPPMMNPEFLPRVRGTNSRNEDSSAECESEGLMSMAESTPVEREVIPKDVRFTQDSISKWIHDGGKQVLLSELLKKLESGERTPESFEMLKVTSSEVARDGQHYSNDNRRLWLFREANIPQVKVKLYSERLKRAPLPMMYPDFLPAIKDSSDGHEAWEDLSN